ncbi:MAG TPA: hypothetical protein ENL09_01050, partial [Bacteroidetes bacterium]|nr:hypothetical protein [Bacteroidota bacterium]
MSTTEKILFDPIAESRPLRFLILEDSELDVELLESMLELEEVTISAEAVNANITRVETGSTKLAIQSIRK